MSQVRVIASTRTPVLLRGFTVGGSTLFPILFAPYFAAIASESTNGIPWSAYLLSLLFAVANGALVAIQVRGLYKILFYFQAFVHELIIDQRDPLGG